MTELVDASTLPSSSDNQLDSVVDGEEGSYHSDDIVKSVTNELIQTLQLSVNENKDQIVSNLLEKGRQSLVHHREDIVAELYVKEMESENGKLLELLKMYFQTKWETEYGLSNQWFSLFLKHYQNGENHNLYERVLIRTAEHGNKYMKNNSVLSIVLQLLFEAIDDICLKETTVFDDLWATITNDGLGSVKKYADYITEDIMNEQMNDKRSPLFQALRGYYRDQLFLLLQRSSIVDRQNLYDFALDNVTEHGWLTGIKAIQKKITPISYEKVYKSIQLYRLQQSKLNQIGQAQTTNELSNSILQSELISTEKMIIQDGPIEEKNRDLHPDCMSSLKSTTCDVNDVEMEVYIQNGNQIISQTYSPMNDQIAKPIMCVIDIDTLTESEYQPVEVMYRENKTELSILRKCKRSQSYLLQLEDLIQAGELQYINQTLDDVAKNLVNKLICKHYSFSEFIQHCLTPIMYLLKRQQNLDDFFISLAFKYQGIQELTEYQSTQRSNLNLRMLLHVLFLNSDIFLQRTIMSLLSKRNPVPLLFPNIQRWDQSEAYEFVPSIIHVWNCTRPTILSFGIGSCRGKSTLLNQLFQCIFEQTVDSIYFQQAIDIDFGYCFNPERILNIADTHGFMTCELLKQIHCLFEGFFIQIEKRYFEQQPEILLKYLHVLPRNKLRMIIVRDVPVNSMQECSMTASTLLNRGGIHLSRQLCVYPLINISNTNDRNVIFAIKKLREELLTKIKSEIQNNNNKYEIESNLSRLTRGNYIQYLERLNRIIQPLKRLLLERNEHRRQEDFPLYLKFQELCKLRQILKKIDFYGTDSERMFATYDKLNKLENELDPRTKTISPIKTGNIFQLFVEILKSEQMLMSLDLLATELKQELLVLGGNKIAGDLAVENVFLSLEVLWRNSIVCYNHTTYDIQNLIAKSYYEFISAGFPFEIIDGDNFHFQHQFLTKVLGEFATKRILVISIIGPQNSGKSTLLNYMFGTLFDVREGRCTRGIYGSLVKLITSNQTGNSTSSGSFQTEIPNIDYIMLIDTEGLLSIEKNDNEYDRRLVLFCLAVSHLVIVNMMGDVNETLKDMLTLCADSLKQIGVNKVNQPIVHFVLNQKADPNLKNHTEAIERIIRDFKERELAEVIDISSRTFHTLPSAFKKERVSNDPQSPCFLRTEPDFIQRTQQLCEKIIQSATASYERSSQTISDPPQWLQTAVTVFDTLQKFPDLTYFKDINERRQDDRIRQHIGELISKTLSAEYRKKTIDELCELSENEIRKQLQAKFDVYQNDLDNDLKIIFKTTNAAERIRERSKQFLKRQVTEISNAWCTATLQAHDQKQMEVLVRDGSDDLRKLIDDLIKNGQIMTKEKATEEFDIMWNKKLDSIKRSFNPQERLKQAIKFVYGNYNIFEKQCLPSYDNMLHQLPFITRLSEKPAIEGVIASIRESFVQKISQQRQSVLEHRLAQANTNITYTPDTIDNFNYLNKQIIKDQFTAMVVECDECMMDSTQQHEVRRYSNKRHTSSHIKYSFIRKGVDAVKNFVGLSQSVATSTEETTAIINPGPLQIDFIRHMNSLIGQEMGRAPNAQSNILRIPKLFDKVLDETIVIVDGNNIARRPIEVDLIQKIVCLVNTIINEANLELLVFKLSLSKQTKSSIHTSILIMLTMFYYDEQKNHFDQQLLTLNKEKLSLLTYFISMVVPDAQCDTEGGKLFANKVKDTIQSKLMRDGQRIVTRIIETQKNLNRKQIQIICDGKLHAAADDDLWLFRYIDAPTDIIVEEFQILWKEVEKTINQQLEKEKNRWKTILLEFFHRIEVILSSLANEGSPVRYIDDIFSASGGVVADNLTNKGQCMASLLYAYLSGKDIELGATYAVFNQNYTLNGKGLRLFGRLSKPSQLLANLINGIRDVNNSNSNCTAIASIKNLHVFLQSIMNAKQMIEEAYDQVPATFEMCDKVQNYNKLLDKVRGCTAKCPCCQRPCDVDHTLVKSNAGDEDNRHCCQTGHQLRAMAGFKFEISNEASLYQCEQMTDDKPIVVRGTKKKWLEFKNDYPAWDFGNSITPDELFKLRGKFLNVWSRIGERLCEKYDMEFVTENTAKALAKSFHYILLLDASGSMKGEPWKNLLHGVREFLKIRVDSGSLDRITIITFESNAKYAYFNEDVRVINVSNITFTGGGTNLSNAFDLVIKTIQSTQFDSSSNNSFGRLEYIIIFMSDGQAEFPHRQMETLSTMQYMIDQFWTVALGNTSMGVLQKINDKMDGTFKELKDSADFVCVYAEIARN